MRFLPRRASAPPADPVPAAAAPAAAPAAASAAARATSGAPDAAQVTALADRARQGDRAAFEQLVVACSRRVYATLYRIVGEVEAARDLTQETFLRVFRSLSDYRAGCPFMPWLYRIATNVALDHLRRTGREKMSSLHDDASPEGADEVIDPGPGPEVTLLAGETRADVVRALATLSAPYRAVLVLRYYQDMSHQEISSVLDLPLATVKVHLHRARAQLARAYTGSDPAARKG